MLDREAIRRLVELGLRARKLWMLRGAVFAVTMLLPAFASAESFICLADLSTGFSWNGREWRIAHFTVNEDRYVVEEIVAKDTIGNYNFRVKKIGSDTIAHWCKREVYGDGTVATRITCGGQGIGFLLDTQSLRFQEIYGIGFLDGNDGKENTPSLTIGKCTRLK